MKSKLPYLLLSIVVLLGAAIGPLWAQDTPATADGDESSIKDGPSIREQSIYIPYDELRKVFEQHGRGVFLPYEEWEALWRLAREKSDSPERHKPPVGALISEITNRATVSKDVVRVKALLKIEILAEGWNTIPLRLAQAAIIGATIDGEPARITGDPTKGYQLLIEKQGTEPEQIELALEYARPVQREPGKNRVTFQAPRSAVNRWEVRIPESGVKVNFEPLIAATEVPPSTEDTATEPPGETVVQAFVGAAATVSIDWTPKAEGATGLEALVSVSAEQEVSVYEGIVQTETTLTYAISRAELPQLTIEVPATHDVVSVTDANVRGWSFEAGAADATTRRIVAQLHDPAQRSQQVVVVLEMLADEESHKSLQIPVVKAVGADPQHAIRQEGQVRIKIDEGLRAEATSAVGLVQVDTKANWAFCYDYAKVPFDLKLNVEKVRPRIVTDTLVEAYIQPERISLDLAVVCTIERAGIFQLMLDVPEEFEVLDVAGRQIGNAAPVEVDTHSIQGEEPNRRLVVNLARRAIGPVGLAVELRKELAEKGDLISYTGKKVDVLVTIPRITINDRAGKNLIERASGRLMVHATESLDIDPRSPQDLASVKFSDALRGRNSTAPQKSFVSRQMLAFTYERHPKEPLSLTVECRKPQVNVEQLLVARIESGLVEYEATFFYDIRYSGKESLRIDLPAPEEEGSNAVEWRLDTKGIRREVIDSGLDDLEPGHVAWILSGESEFLGRLSIKLLGEKPIDEQQTEQLNLGKSITLTVPRLVPKEVDVANGQAVLAKAETLDVRPSPDSGGIEPIDPQHDLIAPVEGAARAFEFHEDWNLDVLVTQYKLEEIKRTIVEHGVVRMVVTRGDEISVQALYRLRSVRQRLEMRLPGEPKFDHDALRINGKPVALEGEEGKTAADRKYFVPLVGLDPKEPFLLELRYSIEGKGRRLRLPEFSEEPDPAVQKVYLCVYLPRERTLLGANGPWTREFRWWIDRSFRWRPATQGAAESLIDDTLSGVQNVVGDPKRFATDGALYIYSSLRPKKGADGELRLVTIDEAWLNCLIIGGVMLIGVLLLPAGARCRIMSVGALVALAVLSQVFMPTFSLQVLDVVMMGAVFLVFLLWVVWYLVRTRPQLLASRPPAAPPMPPPAASFTQPSQQGHDLSASEPEPKEPELPKKDNDEGGKTDA